jgi:peroxiredoxin Q/BCP
MRGLRSAYPGFTEAGADVVAISVDTPEKSRAFVDSLQIPFTILSDSDGELVRKLGILHERGGRDGSDISTPATYVIDRDGKVTWMHRSPDVRTRPDPAEVLAVVKALK